MARETRDGHLGKGLCEACQHGRTVTSSKEATYLLCERSLADSRFPKYPVTPVLTCNGFEEKIISHP
jgi:hypothetical protein